MPRPLLLVFALSLHAFAADENGAALFQKQCAVCHKPAGGAIRAPSPDDLARLPKQSILTALEIGVMKAQGAALTAAEREAIATFLTAPHVARSESVKTNTCPDAASALPDLKGWN